jgi:hypothetical protein
MKASAPLLEARFSALACHVITLVANRETRSSALTTPTPAHTCDAIAIVNKVSNINTRLEVLYFVFIFPPGKLSFMRNFPYVYSLSVNNIAPCLCMQSPMARNKMQNFAQFLPLIECSLLEDFADKKCPQGILGEDQ